MYAEALVMTAIEENIVWVVPSATLARACALITRGHERAECTRLHCTLRVVPVVGPATPRCGL